MFALFIFTNGIFLGILLLIKRSELKNANVFLALFLISLSLELAPDLFEEEGLFVPETSFFTVPLLYLYVQRILKDILKPLLWLWLIPGLLVNGLDFFVGDEAPSLWMVLLVVIPLYGLNLYLLFSLQKQINSHSLALKSQFTSIENRTLQWVKGLVWIFLVFHFVWILDDGLLLASVDYPILATLAELLTLVSVFWVGYFGLGQRASVMASTVEKDTVSPSLSNEADKSAFKTVLQQIEEHKLYLNQELTLRLLAQQVKVNEKKLSSWINQYTERNFYQLINQYRVDEFKRQLVLPENQNYSLLGVAQNSGFRNKSTFYKVFKELEGFTPNDYKKGLIQA